MNIEQIIFTIYNPQQLNYCGINEIEIRESEQRLNLIFPEILRNYYQKFGNNKTLNYNDELFKIQDIFIDYFQDEQYLVIRKKKGSNEFYGIKMTDLKQKNPPVYTKSRIQGPAENSRGSIFMWHESPKKHETLERFLLCFIVENSLSGGLKYGFSVYGTQGVEHTAMLINDGTIAIQKLNDISISKSNSNSSSCLNYYMDNHCAMHVVYVSEENGGKIGFLKFAAGDKNVYQKIMGILNSNGIKISKNDNHANKYKIYKRLSSTIGSIIVSGMYDNWRERRKEAILVPGESINMIYDLLLKANPNFDYYGISTEYSKEQINDLVTLLKTRVDEMKHNENFMFHPKNKIMEYNDFYFRDNIDYRRYKKHIIKMLEGLITWLEAVADDKINIIGV
jgi:hypothetical protein